MQLRSALVLVVLSGAAGCSFDFAPFAPSSTGDGGSTSAAGTTAGNGVTTGAGSPTSTSSGGGASSTGSTTTSNVSGSSSASTTSTTASSTTSTSASTTSSTTASSTTASSTSASTSSSSGTGGASSMPLNACGGLTDNFNTFPGNAWQTHGTPSNPGGQAKVQVAGFDNYAGAWVDTAMFDDCAMTIDLGAQPSVGGDYFLIQSGFNKVEIDYFDATKTLVYPGGTKGVNNKPDSLGIAMMGGQIYFLYENGGTWHLLNSGARPGWMSAASTASLGFGIGSSFAPNSGNFDNFNLPPVSPQDLGI